MAVFQTNRSRRRAEEFEIKGNTLAAPRNKDSRRRQVFIEKVFELVTRYCGRLFCVSVIKNPDNPTSATSIYTFSLQYMVERFNIFITEHPEYDAGIIIADEADKFENDVVSSHVSFVFGHETGKMLTKIVEAPLFANSKYTAGLQLVDNLSSVVYSNHYYHHCKNVPNAVSYEHMKKYWMQLKSVEFKSKRKYDGHIKYGFRTINHCKPDI